MRRVRRAHRDTGASVTGAHGAPYKRRAALNDRHQARRLPLRARIAAISDGPSAVSAEPSTTTTAPA